MKVVFSIIIILFSGLVVNAQYTPATALEADTTATKRSELIFIPVSILPSYSFGQNIHMENNRRNILAFISNLKGSAFFCAWEYAVEGRSKVAPRFRLGSVDEVDRLENKLIRYD